MQVSEFAITSTLSVLASGKRQPHRTLFNRVINKVDTKVDARITELRTDLVFFKKNQLKIFSIAKQEF